MTSVFGGMSEELARLDRQLGEVGVEQATSGLQTAACRALDRVCDAYFEAAPGSHDALRKGMEEYGELLDYLFVYMGYTIERLRHTSDQVWLRRMLSAVSLEDARPDQQDTVTRLHELLDACDEIGVDARPLIEQLAAVSNDEVTVGFQSTAALLADFAERAGGAG